MGHWVVARALDNLDALAYTVAPMTRGLPSVGGELRRIPRPLRVAVLAVATALPVLRAPLQAQDTPKTIREIRIRTPEGELKRESEGDLLARLRIRVGDTYDRTRVRAETAHLFMMGKFSSVGPPKVTEFPDSVVIDFVVTEREFVEEVEFRGRSALSAKHLRTEPPALQTVAKTLLNDAYLVQDREIIEEKYHDAGFIFARVETLTEATEAGNVRVVFRIDEGPRVRIRQVEFVGNENVASGTLRRLMSTREKDFWFFGLLRPGFYDYDLLAEDLVRIERYYERYGYLDARAELEEIRLDRDKKNMTVLLRVQEGPRYTFRGYSFVGNLIYRDETLLDLMTAVPGEPFDAGIMQKDRQEIFNYYGDRAYIDAEVAVRPIYDETGNDIEVIFEIEENNEVFIEEVRIRGNEKTREKVVRREIEIYPGERVDRSKLVKTRSNLNRLQIFSNVRYEFEEGETPGHKDLVWTVEEEQSGRLIIGFGVTSGFGVIGNFNVTKRNFDITDLPESFYDIPDSFTGNGQTLTIAAQPGTQRSLYRLSFTEPYVFGTRNALTLSAASLTILRRDYDEDRASFSPTLRHSFDFDRDLAFSIGGRIEEVEISDLDNDAPPDAFDAKGFTTILAASAGLSYDKVLYEYLEGPYSGTGSSVIYEKAGGVLGGDLDFHKVELSNDFYWPVYEYQRGPETLHHVVSLINRFGVIEPDDSKDSIPIFERFFLGGPNTVRGFDFRGLGPHQGNDPVGGTGMLYGNLEYSFPLFQKLLRGVVFLDYGNLATEFSEFTFDEMRIAVGGGLRINFPFLGQPLPIGLYLGTPLRKEDDDESKVFLFTIGTPF